MYNLFFKAELFLKSWLGCNIIDISVSFPTDKLVEFQQWGSSLFQMQEQFFR